MNRKELVSGTQRSEKAVGDAEPELTWADPLLVFLQDLSAKDANEWHAVLLARRVQSRRGSVEIGGMLSTPL